MKRFFISMSLSLITGAVSCCFFFSLYGLVGVYSPVIFKHLGLYAYLCNFSHEARLTILWSMDAFNFVAALLPVLFITGTALGNTVRTNSFFFSVLAFIGFYLTILHKVGSITLSRPIVIEIVYAFLVLSCLACFIQYGSRKRPFVKTLFQAVK